MSAEPAGTTRVEPRARFVDLLAAEWIKIWSLRSIGYGLVALALVVIGSNVNGSRVDYATWPRMSVRQQETFYALKDAFSNSSILILMLGAGSIGAIVVVSEYSSGLIRTTFAAVPARMSVLLAKVLVVAGLFTGFGAAVAGVSFGVSQAILDGRGAAVQLGDPGVLRAAVASALLAPVCALTGMGLGVLIRHTATSVVATTVLLLLVPGFFDDRRSRWEAGVVHALPYGAWQRLVDVAPQDQIPGDYVDTVGHAFLVLGGWAVVAAVVAVVTVRGRDV